MDVPVNEEALEVINSDTKVLSNIIADRLLEMVLNGGAKYAQYHLTLIGGVTLMVGAKLSMMGASRSDHPDIATKLQELLAIVGNQLDVEKLVDAGVAFDSLVAHMKLAEATPAGSA